MTRESDFGKALSSEKQIETEETLRRENYALRQRSAAAEKKASTADSVAKERGSALDEAHRELSLYKAPMKKRPSWLVKAPKTGKEVGTIVTMLSDTHYGEVVEAKEMNEYNAFNMDIAKVRTEAYFGKVISAATNYIGGVDYSGIVLALGGDLVSGDIHEELEQTNELSTYDTVLEVLPWLETGILSLRDKFGSIHVVSAPGNHGRDSKKPRFKHRSAHNVDTLIGRLLAWHLKDEDGVSFDIPESMDVDFPVYGSVFSMEHGDNMRFAGTSEIGAFGPVKRGTLRKSRQRLEEGRPFDYLLVGHFHQFIPAWTQGMIMNGTLKGYDEYAKGWKFTPEPAQQALLLVTPEKGIAQALPIIVQDRGKEGW
jgi:hypothetical protein